MKSLNFAILTENFRPFVGGGIAEWTHGVADSLRQLGHQVTVFAKWKKKVRLDLHKDKSYTVKPMYGRDWGRYRYWYSFYYLWKILRENPATIVIATTWDLAAPLAVLRKLFPDARLIVIAHGKDIAKVRSWRMLRRFRKTIEVSDLVSAVSQFTRNQIFARLTNHHAQHVQYIPNGIDVDVFQPTDNYQDVLQELRIPPAAKIILTLARVIERKGHDTVIRCLPKIVSEFPETVYLIAGPVQDQRYLQKLNELIEKLKLGKHVVFVDEVSKENLGKYYSMSDVYVMVSREDLETGDTEGFPITFLEANGCRCPVIGSYAGGIADAIEDGKNGFLVPPDDEQALAERILTLFRNPDLADQIGRYGRQRVERYFTWEQITDRLLREFFKRVQ